MSSVAISMLIVFSGVNYADATGPDAYRSEDARVIWESGFEDGQAMPDLHDHKVTEETARSGERSLVAEVTEANRAVMLHVPFEAKRGEVVHLWFHILSDNRCAATTFALVGGERVRIGNRVERIPVNKWERVHAMYRPEADVRGELLIAAPTSFNAPVGKVWIDDITVLAAEDECQWIDQHRDFPALTRDQRGSYWLATLDRTPSEKRIRVAQIDEKFQLTSESRLGLQGLTGLGAPAVAGLKQGCVVAFSVERNDRWQVAYATVEPEFQSTASRFIESKGNSNIAPALAVAGDDVHVVWESNGDGYRRIYGCRLTPEGAGEIHAISSPGVNSYNPAIVTLADGSLFAAWDSFQHRNADIYGAAFREGRWEKERRLTDDPRIERHPSLAVWKDELWLAWQAQSYERLRMNSLTEQLVCVARLDARNPMMPAGVFRDVSTASRLLMRPRIAFDGEGRLWLSARESQGQHAGWRPMAWTFTGEGWSDPYPLMFQEGRWRPVDMVADDDGVVAVCQYDEVPSTGTRGPNPDWRSNVRLERLESNADPLPGKRRLRKVALPETTFSTAVTMERLVSDLPRQSTEHNGRQLQLNFGGLHEHTDISICARSTNPPGHDLFASGRDIAKLDFEALTDHGFNFDNYAWAYNGEQTRMHHDPGRFVTFLGQEWTSSSNPPAEPGGPNRYGHHNVIYLEPYYDRYHDAFDADISPADLWKQLSGVEFVCIPHQLADWEHKGKGNPPTDWSFTDERLQPVAEIFQARGSYECFGCPRQSRSAAPFEAYYLQDAWAKGIVIGTIASPDHGGGMGKAGVWAETHSRESIFRAIQQRHTFGTSGAKISLFVAAGDAMMGDKVASPDGPITFNVEVQAGKPVTDVVILQNNTEVHHARPNRTECRVSWTDGDKAGNRPRWYYVRVHTQDNELAWSSPIWFMPRGQS